jgi:hypothetical protein
MKKTHSLIIFFTILGIIAPLAISAQTNASNLLSGTGEYPTKQLEVDYPAFAHTTPPTDTSAGLPNYIKYIYMAAIIISGFIALLMIVIAGVRYMASVGSPSKMGDAKDQIYSAILGLAILIGSWLILTTINPQITYLKEANQSAILPDISPGVYACKQRVDMITLWNQRRQAENQTGSQLQQASQQLNQIKQTIDENCYILPGKSDLKEDFQGQVAFIYLVPAYKTAQYGVIVYESPNFGGKANAIYGDAGAGTGIQQMEQPTEWSVSSVKVSSAMPFILNFNPPSTWKAQLFELTNYNRNVEQGKADMKECLPGKGQSRATSTCTLPQAKYSKIKGNPKIGSVIINGDMFIVFRNETSWTIGTTEIDVVAGPQNANLNNHPMGAWDQSCIETTAENPGGEHYPCAKVATLVAANFY